MGGAAFMCLVLALMVWLLWRADAYNALPQNLPGAELESIGAEALLFRSDRMHCHGSLRARAITEHPTWARCSRVRQAAEGAPLVWMCDTELPNGVDLGSVAVRCRDPLDVATCELHYTVRTPFPLIVAVPFFVLAICCLLLVSDKGGGGGGTTYISTGGGGGTHRSVAFG